MHRIGGETFVRMSATISPAVLLPQPDLGVRMDQRGEEQAYLDRGLTKPLRLPCQV